MVKRKKKTESRPHSEQHFKIHQHIGIKIPLQDFPCASKINRERKMYTCQFCTAKADHILSKLYLLNKQEAWRAVGTQWTSNFCQLHFFFLNQIGQGSRCTEQAKMSTMKMKDRPGPGELGSVSCSIH